jgi:hypothetical protein
MGLQVDFTDDNLLATDLSARGADVKCMKTWACDDAWIQLDDLGDGLTWNVRAVVTLTAAEHGLSCFEDASIEAQVTVGQNIGLGTGGGVIEFRDPVKFAAEPNADQGGEPSPSLRYYGDLSDVIEPSLTGSESLVLELHEEASNGGCEEGMPAAVPIIIEWGFDAAVHRGPGDFDAPGG